MSERATELAERFRQANEEFIEEVQSLSGEQWLTDCPAEGWAVGVVVHHVAHGTTTIMRHIMDLLATPMGAPETGETIHRRNAEDAARFAAYSQAETLTELQHTGAAAVDLVRGLTDEQLARRGPIVVGMRAVDVAWLAGFLMGHMEEHRQNIRSALGRVRPRASGRD